MKLGEFFIELGVKGNTKELKKSLDQMKEAEKQTKRQIDLERDLSKATTEEQKALIKKNYAQKDEIDKTEKAIKVKNEHKQAILGAVRGFTAFVGSVAVVVTALDRLINASARANQQMITLSRTSGISLGSFNKYASASASVNYNSSPEQVAQSMQNVASNLWDIRMGRGDISPYQELGFIGGKAINPYGKNVEQIIEEVRESIKGVNDLQATNIITRMGFSPDDLLMLRMSKKEIAEIQDLFMSPKEQEKMNKYALELKKVHMQFDLLKNQILLKVMPPFITFMKHISTVAEVWSKVVFNISEFIEKSAMAKTAILGLGTAFVIALAKANPLITGLTALYLILEDLAFAWMGYDSVIGSLFKPDNKSVEEKRNDLMSNSPMNTVKGFFEQIGKNAMQQSLGQGGIMQPGVYNPQNNINQNNSVVVNTTQPADKATANAINGLFGSYINQYVGSY